MSAVRTTAKAGETTGKPACQSELMAALLRRPEAYPERTRQVSCIETHISRVFITDRFVYKLKRPVVYDFLDFSAPELRRQACKDEVRLNRRLAPDVYLEVVPITSDRRGRLKVGGSAVPVDWLVKMRRLPADRALDRLIRTRSLTESDLRALARKLADFYQRLPPLTVKTDDYRRVLEQHIRANRDILLRRSVGSSAALVKRVHSAQLRLLRISPDLLDDRVRDGRIVEGHGDLRPEHIYLCQTPAVIDCVEFNREFRVVDVLDELGFLAMECECLGAGYVGEEIVHEYCRRSGDWPSSALLHFYQCYRAFVRAKISSLRAGQLPAANDGPARDAVDNYLHVADRCAASLGPPLLLVVRGLPGTGKSTLAEAVEAMFGLELLQTDAVRRELFGPILHRVGYNQERYLPENRAKVYREMFRRAGQLLDQGLSVILDGMFLSASSRLEATALAERRGAAPLVIHCRSPDEVALERLSGRNGGAAARPEFYHLHRRVEEPDPHGLPACEVDTQYGLPAAEEAVFSRLRQIILPAKSLAVV